MKRTTGERYTSECRECHKEFSWLHGTGRPPQFCGDSCRNHYWRITTKPNSKHAGDPVTAECCVCHNPFTYPHPGRGMARRYCGPECLRRAVNLRARDRYNSRKSVRRVIGAERYAQLKEAAKVGSATRYGVLAMQRGWRACVAHLLSAIPWDSPDLTRAAIRETITESEHGKDFPSVEKHKADAKEARRRKRTERGVDV